jgi:hypothetical protein
VTNEQLIAFENASAALAECQRLTPVELPIALEKLSDAANKLGAWKRQMENAAKELEEAKLLEQFRRECAEAGESYDHNSPMEDTVFRAWKLGRRSAKNK